MVYNFFDRKTSVEQLKMVISQKKKKKKKIEELRKPIIKKFEKSKVHLLQTIFGCRFSRYANELQLPML